MADMTASSSEPEASVQETPISYVKTKKGLVLATEVVLSLVVLICNAVWAGTWNWIYLPICAMIFSAAYIVIFVMELGKRFSATVLQWLCIGDLIRAVLFSILYLISSLITIGLMVILHFHLHVDGAGIAGVVFSVIASPVYAYDAYTIGLQLRSSRQPTHRTQLFTSV